METRSAYDDDVIKVVYEGGVSSTKCAQLATIEVLKSSAVTGFVREHQNKGYFNNLGKL